MIEAPAFVPKPDLVQELGPNTSLAVETYKSPQGVGGVAARFGRRYEIDDVWSEIKDAYEVRGNPLADEKRPGSAGFNELWRWEPGTSRKQMAEYEFEVAKIVLDKILEVNEWEKKEIGGVVLGSGVPIVDQLSGDSYVRALTEGRGFRQDLYTSETFAACNSWGHQYIEAAKNPALQGKKVVIMAMEGITALAPDFDPEKADIFSTMVFSNGGGGVGLIPGEDITLYETAHKVSPDTKGALKAHMTYPIDMEAEDIWQGDESQYRIRGPHMTSGMLLEMQPKSTAVFFLRNTVEIGIDIYNRQMNSFDKRSDVPRISEHPRIHFASEPVVGGWENNVMKSVDIVIDVPRSVPDGNSSAATTPILYARELPNMEEGQAYLVMSYGAGGSFTGGFVEPHAR